MFSSLVKRALLYKLFYELIFFSIIAEVLRFLVLQCVLSFGSRFQYALLPLLTSHLSDRSINTIQGSCKYQHCYCRCLVAPPSLLHAAVTIVVKKRLVNSITFFLYPQLRQAPKELPESSQKAPRELPSPSLSEICVLIRLSKTADKQSFLGTTWRF